MSLQFNDETNKQGLIQDCEITLFGDEGYGSISGDSDRMSIFTSLLNQGLNKATTQILESDTRWQFDDTSATDYPIGTTNIVSGQRDYQMDVTHLKILKVLLKDSAGFNREIYPFDINDPRALSYLENNTNNSGNPLHYDVAGNTIFLDPIPNYNYTGGLTVYYQRALSFFTTSDTTKVPGIPSIFHRYISRWACYDYALTRQMPIARALREEIIIMEGEMEDFYSKRNRGDIQKMSAAITLSR